MGRSLDYIKKHTDLNLNKAGEIKATRILKFDRDNHVVIKCHTKDDYTDSDIEVELMYNPDANFNYIVKYSLRHDGTIWFISDCVSRCLDKVLDVNAYNIGVGANPRKLFGRYKFEIGDVIVVNEYGKQFSTAEKPWMQCRTTAMCPVVRVV